MMKKLLNIIFFFLIAGTIGVSSVKGIEFFNYDSLEAIELADFNESDGDPIDDDEKEASLEIELISLLQTISIPDISSHPSTSSSILPTFISSYIFYSIKPPMV